MDININNLFINLINKSYYLNSIEKNILVITKKTLRAKYNGCGKTSYKEKTYYKLYSKQRPNASFIIDVLFIVYSNISYNILLTNLHSIPVATYSDFLHSILPIASLTNSYILITAHSDFLYNISSIILLTNLYSVLSIIVYSKSINRLALLAKYLSSN